MYIKMPQLGLTMEQGTLQVWLKGEGDYVHKGDILAEISTEKATTELEAPEEGLLEHILVKVGEVVPVGADLAYLRQKGEPAMPPDKVRPEISIHPPEEMDTIRMVEKLTREMPQPAWLASEESVPGEEPSLFADNEMLLAPEESESLDGLGGEAPATGEPALFADQAVQTTPPRIGPLAASPEPSNGGYPAGASRPDQNSYRFSGQAEVEAPLASPVKISQFEAAIRDGLPEVQAGVQPVTLWAEVEISRLAKLIHELGADPLLRAALDPEDFVALALARVLARHPFLNSTWQVREGEDEAVAAPRPEIKLNLAVPLDGQPGQVMPVLPVTGHLDLFEIARRRGALVERTRAGLARAADLEKGTFTLINLGSTVVERFNPPLNPPQVAALGLGRAYQRPGPAGTGGPVQLCTYLALSLTIDQRAVQPALAAAFLTGLAGLLEWPYSLLVDPSQHN